MILEARANDWAPSGGRVTDIVAQKCSSIVGLLDDDEIRLRATRLLTDDFGFHMSWIADSTEGGVRIGQTSGARTRNFAGLLVRRGRGLGGKVYEDGLTRFVDDYLGAPDITHDYDGPVASEQVRRMFAAPMLVGKRNFGVLLGAHRDDGECGDIAASVLEEVAGHCGQALFVAERARSAASAAAGVERRRVAAELGGVADLLGSIARNATSLAEVPGIDGELATRLRSIEREADRATALWRDSLRALDSLDQTLGTRDRTKAGRGRSELHQPIATREYEVLRRVATGETNAEIAAAMCLSCNTVKTYLRNVMSKLGARNRVEAIVHARRIGLL